MAPQILAINFANGASRPVATHLEARHVVAPELGPGRGAVQPREVRVGHCVCSAATSLLGI